MEKILPLLIALVAALNSFVAAHTNLGGAVLQPGKIGPMIATSVANNEITAKEDAKTSYEAGKYYTPASEPFKGISTITAELVLDDADIDDTNLSITRMALEQSTDGGESWKEMTAIEGWRGAPPVASSVVPDGFEERQVTMLKEPGSVETETVVIQVPKFKEINPIDNPDDFHAPLSRQNPGFVVQVPDDGAERVFRIFFEVPQAINATVLFAAK